MKGILKNIDPNEPTILKDGALVEIIQETIDGYWIRYRQDTFVVNKDQLEKEKNEKRLF